MRGMIIFMKRIFSIVLAVLMMLSVLPTIASAADEVTLTNVALNRPGFASNEYVENGKPYFADLATDGNVNTYFWNTSAGRYYVDLGADYTINQINLNLSTVNADVWWQNITIYLCSSRPNLNSSNAPDGSVSIYSSTSTATRETDGILEVETDETVRKSKYRYVFLVKSSGAIRISELQALSSDDTSNATYQVEVGAFKPVFAASGAGNTSGTTVSNYLPWYANDRSMATTYHSDDIKWATTATDPGIKQYFVVDLGESIPLYGVAYRPDYGNGEVENRYNVRIYVSNDPNVLSTSNIVVTAHANNVDNYYELPASISGQSFRYVIVTNGDNTQRAENSVTYNHRKITIRDIKVYSDNKNGRTTNYSTSDTSKRAHLISYYMPITGDEHGTYKLACVVDGDPLTRWVQGINGRATTAKIDLGKPQKIDYITTAMGSVEVLGAAYDNDNMYFFATNGTDNEYDSSEDILLGSFDGSQMLAGSTYLFEAPETANKYRYVVIYAEDADVSNNSVYPRINLGMLDVYTKESNLDEAHTSIKFARDTSDTNKFTVAADKFISATGRKYKFIAAAYDASENLIEVKSADISVNKGMEGPITSSVSFAGSENLSKIATVKTMLWDFDDQYRPVAVSQEFSY